MAKAPDRSVRTSDTPEELRAEREEFLKNFLQKGVQLAEDLVRENHSLIERIAQLEAENGRLRRNLESDDASRELMASIAELERERSSLQVRSDELERVSQQLEGRYHQTERELHDLASLYVASSQLSKARTPKRVVTHILELLEQLVGAQAVVLYVVNHTDETLVPIASNGMKQTDLVEVPLEENHLADACLTGLTRIRTLPEVGSVTDPLAVIPMLHDGRAIAAISIIEALPQKQAWESVDEGLFRLLAEHGSRALLTAKLYDEQHEPVTGLSDLEMHLNSTGAGEKPSSGGVGA